MSDAVFPTLAGLTFPVRKTPIYSTTIKTSVSHRELRRANMAAPVWGIGLVFEFLRDQATYDDLKTLMGFFLARKGAFDSFLFNDPDDNTVVNEQIGVGDGVTTSFQLTRTYGGVTEAVANVNLATLIAPTPMWSVSDAMPMWSVSDTMPMWSSYTLSPSGLLTFNVPPAAGVPVIWTGNFYYRCRFMVDQADFSKFMDKLWELKKCDLLGSLGTKI